MTWPEELALIKARMERSGVVFNPSPDFLDVWRIRFELIHLAGGQYDEMDYTNNGITAGIWDTEALRKLAPRKRWLSEQLAFWSDRPDLKTYCLNELRKVYGRN